VLSKVVCAAGRMVLLAATETRLAHFRKADRNKSDVIAKLMRKSAREHAKRTQGLQNSQSLSSLPSHRSTSRSTSKNSCSSEHIQCSQGRLKTFRQQQERMMLQVEDNIIAGATLGRSKSQQQGLLSERKRKQQETTRRKQKQVDDSWYQKPATVAGEGNPQGTVLSRLASPGTFTGQYRQCYQYDEALSGSSIDTTIGGYVDPVRKGTRDMLRSKSSKKGELSIKCGASNFRNEVEWRMSIRRDPADSPRQVLQVQRRLAAIAALPLPQINYARNRRPGKKCVYPSRSNTDDMARFPTINNDNYSYPIGLRD